MKFKQRALALILSVMMVLTFMPALAYADDDTAAVKAPAKAAAKIPVSIEYTTSEMLTGTIGKTIDDVSPNKTGAVLTITYKDGSSETYVRLEGEYDDEGWEYIHEPGWYLNGDYGNGEADLWLDLRMNGRLKEGENECTLILEDDDENRASCTVTVIGVPSEDVVSVSYNHVGGELKGTANFEYKRIEYLLNEAEQYDDGVYVDESWKELEGDTITIVRRVEDWTYNESTDDYDVVVREEPKTYTCMLCEDEYDKDYRFVCEIAGEEDTGYETVYPEFYDDQVEGEWTWAGSGSGEVTVAYDGVAAPQKLAVRIPEVRALKSAEIVLAPDFEPYISVGQDDSIGYNAFAAKGNKLIITFSNGDEETLEFNEDEWEFVDENGDWIADIYADLEEQGIVLEKDVPTEVTFVLEYVIGRDEYDDEIWDKIEFKHTLTAKKWSVYADYNVAYEYTGKLIKPKVAIRTAYGNKKIPSDAFVVDTKGFKTVGWHWFDVRILDTDTYRPEYEYGDTYMGASGEPDTFSLDMVIYPKKPTGKKPAALSKGFTAKWKLDKATKKTVDGIIIEYSTSKNFNNSKYKRAKKSATSLKVTKLKSKKTYYVRYYTYKKVKVTYEDEKGKIHRYTQEIWSDPSKKFKIKTK